MNNSLPERLREALNQKNISQEELANNIGITQGTISLILRGVTKNSRHFPAIAKALDVELDWLLYGKGNRNLNDKFSTPMDTEKFLTDIGVALVNSFQSVNVSAGFGSFNDGTTTPDGVMPYSLSFLNSLHVKAKECAVFWAKGDSMLPTINNGDQLLVDLSQNAITGNNIYLIQNKDSVWVKRVRTSWNGIDLISDNREEYPIIHIESTEAEHLKVIGRVVHIGHSLILK